MGKLHQGVYTPKNPQKYRGNPESITFRSGWEKQVMLWADSNKAVLEWSSEEHVLWYISPVDGQKHRYFLDFWLKIQTKEGPKEFLVEVKPHKQTIPPVKPKRQTKRFLTEVMTWSVNQAKWNAANEFCKRNGMKFIILTEKNVNFLGK